ncbi:MAG TPA: hypothetical protein VEM59_08225 [Acidimicrobiia bacterium]|nr:hypothetical protein [Acidimicrobiia bacterium]
MSTDAAATALFAFGYPVSIVVILRFVPVVRERRWKWFAAHQLAVAAIVTGFVLKGDRRAVAVNSSWLAVSTVWYALGGRRAST